MRLGRSFPTLDVSPASMPFLIFKLALPSFAPVIVAADVTGVMPILVGGVNFTMGIS
jgi:hypothetical protein